MWLSGRSLHGDTVWGYRVCLCIPHPYPHGLANNKGGCVKYWEMWYAVHMTAQILKDMVKRAETWPPEVQEELAEIAREMDDALKGGMYHATPEELAGIERGLKAANEGRFASDADMAALFEKYRPA